MHGHTFFCRSPYSLEEITATQTFQNQISRPDLTELDGLKCKWLKWTAGYRKGTGRRFPRTSLIILCADCFKLDGLTFL